MSLGKRRLEEETQIDLTPMLDVVFILLIFFVITAAFVDETAIDVQHAPTSTSPATEESQDIIFHVSADNDILLEGRRVDIRSVRANVERLHASNPETKVIINTDSRALTATYIRIADQAIAAGIENVVLVTTATSP
ncbi:MAG: biopolymer transporter ExbD [Gammaproteobacteria bacterium]|nr:MAG: biopolymer transporter ExbD [Gammaproteobacteria bacterium]RLA53398.1 MAG: biopolymer transporter ExbD [Gammaproteobacteria bacterium]